MRTAKKQNNIYLVLIIIFLGIVAFIIIWKLDEPRQKAINKYQCAVWGKMEDCVTPLAPEDRLK